MAINMSILKNVEEQRERLVEHLLEKGWKVNLKYIEKKKKDDAKYGRKTKGAIRNSDDVDFNALIRGEYKEDYHLISNCEKYTVRITKTTANFWRVKSWTRFGEYYIDEIELTENGIRAEIVSIEINDAQ